MKTIFLAVAAASLVSAGVNAQTASQTTGQATTRHDDAAGTDHNPAIKDSDPARASVGANGANSFTEGQARSRLTDAGYTDVTKLAKDRKGVWRGTAMKGGASVKVGLDYKGNVTTR